MLHLVDELLEDRFEHARRVWQAMIVGKRESEPRVRKLKSEGAKVFLQTRPAAHHCPFTVCLADDVFDLTDAADLHGVKATERCVFSRL
jgi:hypothetical protein